MHNQIRIRSLKNYTPELLIEELEKINFANYNFCSDDNVEYSDLVQRSLSVLNKIAPFQHLRVKHNTQDWFDEEVAEAINLGEKLKKIKTTKLHIYEDFYKEAKYSAQKLTKEKQSRFKLK